MENVELSRNLDEHFLAKDMKLEDKVVGLGRTGRVSHERRRKPKS